MNLDYQQVECEAPQYVELVKTASRYLEKEVGRYALQVKAKWDFVGKKSSQNGPPRFRLTLEYDSYEGTRQEFFTLDDLTNEKRIRRKFASLWSDLLELNTQIQIQKVHELVLQMEDEE